MFSSLRNVIISAVMALLLIGSSVAAATGFDAFSFSSSEPSLDDNPSSSDNLSDVSGSDSSAGDLDASSSDSGDPGSSDLSNSDLSSSSSDSSDDSGGDSSSSSPSAVDDGTLAEPVTYDVADVGTVTVARGGNVLHVTETTVATAMEEAGWSAVIERADAIEVEVSFRGPGRVDFKAEIEHGEVRIRIRDRRLEASSSGSSNSGSSSSGSSGSSHSSGSDSSGRSDSEVTQSLPASTDTQTATGVGGIVTVRSTGTELSLGTATPNMDWSMDVRDRGPSRVDVRFEKGNSETHIRFEISGGTVTVKVEERT